MLREKRPKFTNLYEMKNLKLLIREWLNRMLLEGTNLQSILPGLPEQKRDKRSQLEKYPDKYKKRCVKKVEQDLELSENEKEEIKKRVMKKQQREKHGQEKSMRRYGHDRKVVVSISKLKKMSKQRKRRKRKRRDIIDIKLWGPKTAPYTWDRHQWQRKNGEEKWPKCELESKNIYEKSGVIDWSGHPFKRSQVFSYPWTIPRRTMKDIIESIVNDKSALKPKPLIGKHVRNVKYYLDKIRKHPLQIKPTEEEIGSLREYIDRLETGDMTIGYVSTSLQEMEKSINTIKLNRNLRDVPQVKGTTVNRVNPDSFLNEIREKWRYKKLPCKRNLGMRKKHSVKYYIEYIKRNSMTSAELAKDTTLERKQVTLEVARDYLRKFKEKVYSGEMGGYEELVRILPEIRHIRKLKESVKCVDDMRRRKKKINTMKLSIEELKVELKKINEEANLYERAMCLAMIPVSTKLLDGIRDLLKYLRFTMRSKFIRWMPSKIRQTLKEKKIEEMTKHEKQFAKDLAYLVGIGSQIVDKKEVSTNICVTLETMLDCLINKLFIYQIFCNDIEENLLIGMSKSKKEEIMNLIPSAGNIFGKLAAVYKQQRKLKIKKKLIENVTEKKDKTDGEIGAFGKGQRKRPKNGNKDRVNDKIPNLDKDEFSYPKLNPLYTSAESFKRFLKGMVKLKSSQQLRNISKSSNRNSFSQISCKENNKMFKRELGGYVQKDTQNLKFLFNTCEYSSCNSDEMMELPKKTLIPFLHYSGLLEEKDFYSRNSELCLNVKQREKFHTILRKKVCNRYHCESLYEYNLMTAIEEKDIVLEGVEIKAKQMKDKGVARSAPQPIPVPARKSSAGDKVQTAQRADMIVTGNRLSLIIDGYVSDVLMNETTDGGIPLQVTYYDTPTSSSEEVELEEKRIHAKKRKPNKVPPPAERTQMEFEENLNLLTGDRSLNNITDVITYDCRNIPDEKDLRHEDSTSPSTKSINNYITYHKYQENDRSPFKRRYNEIKPEDFSRTRCWMFSHFRSLNWLKKEQIQL